MSLRDSLANVTECSMVAADKLVLAVTLTVPDLFLLDRLELDDREL